MRLISLHLKNFKGIKDFTFEPDGKSADIFGANESGKTTVYDGLTFLLTGKDSRDRSPDSFGIKTRNSDGEVMHNLNHEVEGVFDTITLRKVYKEKWTRKRGASTDSFTGHKTKYYVDGVPVKASEYQEAVEEIMPEELLKMLTMPDYFPDQMHWTDRREVLFELAGDIDVEDIVSNYTELKRYPEVLGDRTHDQQEKVLKSQKRELNKELDNIPSRIDELNGRLYHNVGNVEEARATVETLNKNKEKIEAKRSKVKSGGRIADLKVEKSEIIAKKRKAENEHQQTLADNLKELRQKVSNRQDAVDEAESNFRQAKREYESLEDSLRNKNSDIDTIKEELEDISSKEPKPANAFEPEKCPVCEQTMPDADEHDYEAYLDEFNSEKANELKIKRTELAEAEKDGETIAAQLEVAKDKAARAKGKLNQRKQALEKVQAELKRKKKVQTPFESTIPYKELTVKIDDIEEKIANHRQEKQSQLEKLDSHLSAINDEIESSKSTIHKAKENERTQERIAELQEERKEVRDKLEQVEADLHLMEEFVRARSAYVTDKVNEKFEHVSWRLFQEQINSGVDECCDAIYKGVPFDEGLNNAGRIQAGLDIINTLSKHYGKEAPVWVDNAEGITSIPDYDLQIIALYVSEKDEELRVETTEGTMSKAV